MSHVDNKAIKIPSDHYVGFQKRQGDDVPLAFMTIDGTDKAAEKRKATVDAWAKGNTWQAHSKQATLTPKSLVNKPLSGFKMGRNISYGSGWDSRHDKWRLEDPRGFQLEISSGNLQQIMQLCTIEKGEILEQCIWGRLGQENILIPISSPVYTTAAANTERLNSKATIRDAKPGYHLVFKNGDEATYFGKMFAFGFATKERYTDANGHEQYRQNKPGNFKTFNEKPIHTYGLLDKDGKITRIVMRDSLTLSEIRVADELTQSDACVEINKVIAKQGTGVMDTPGKWTGGYGYDRILQVTPEIIDATGFSHVMGLKKLGNTDETTEFLEEHKLNNPYDYSTNHVLVNIGDDWTKTSFNREWKKPPAHAHFHAPHPIHMNDHSHSKLDTDKLINDHFIDYIRVMSEATSGWGFSSRRYETNVQLKWAKYAHTDATYYKLIANYTSFSGADMFIDYTYG